MIANKILYVLISVLAFFVIPIQLVTTLVLGIAVTLTFGLLLFPITLIWMLFYGPLLGLSWVCNKIPVLRDFIGIAFIPWAVVADTFVCLMPAMGELESRALKMMMCQSWPFTWEFSQFVSGRLDLDSQEPEAISAKEIVNRLTRGNVLMQRVVTRISRSELLDPLV